MKNDLLLKLKKFLHSEGSKYDLPTDFDISTFEASQNVLLPADLKEYFKSVNGSEEKYDHFFFLFKSIIELKKIGDELIYHDGSPDYSNIVNTLPSYHECYTFCDYEFHLMTYAIRLFNLPSDKNPVYVICGDRYNEIASSFSEFIELYFVQSDKLFI